MNTIGSRIKTRRLELGMTQGELAQAVGCKSPTISQIESDLRQPSCKTLCGLSDALRVSIEQLLGRTTPTALLVDSKMREMFSGLLELTEKDKDVFYEFYEFLKTKNERRTNET